MKIDKISLFLGLLNCFICVPCFVISAIKKDTVFFILGLFSLIIGIVNICNAIEE
jgi:uncharacterized membrane protein HdeD (DUF308 family)